jgi:alkanesulfonate monooxygenase SsuD/methylene tetrahydromethanopterin reductase-like flavin-dependent oxidoreductase (luciferase family)
MRIGYLVDVHGGPYDQPMPDRENVVATQEAMIEECIIAERSGFHGIQIPDRHGRTETYFPGSLPLLTILARETEKVAIGSFALVLTLYNPMLVAEQVAVIDNLSRGRAYLTVARGFHPGYWNYFGVEQEKLLGRFLEGVEILKTAFQGERFSFDGKHYKVVDSILAPQPFQKQFPIWGGGQLARAIKRCGRYAEAWTCDPFPLLKETWEEQVGAYREEARKHGREPFVVLMRDGWVADTFEQAAKEFGTHYIEEMKFYFRQGIMAHHPDFNSEEKLTPEGTRKHVIVGSPQDCIEQIEYYQEEFGVDYITMRFRMPTGPSLEQSKDTIQRFGEEVVSYFHKKNPPLEHPAIPEGARW